MYVIIGGAGDAGHYLGKLLRSEGHEVTFIERDNSAITQASDIDAMMVKGDVCDPKSLKDAEIARGSYYVGLVKEDSANLASCALANSYGCGTLARVKNPYLAGEAISRRYTNMGVDYVLCPPLITASQISRVFAFPSKLRDLKKKGIGLYHIVVEDKSACCKKSISHFRLPLGAKIASVFRGVEQILPIDTLRLQAEDELCILLDNRAEKKEVEKALGIRLNQYSEVNDVFIAGATDTGLTLAQKLLDSGISVLIMDLSERRTQIAAEKLPKASVVHSDPLGHGILKKEEIERFSVLIASGFGMERNILISVLAKQFGVPTSLALVDRIDLKASVERTLVDDVMVPNLLMIKTSMNLLRGKETVLSQMLQREEIWLKDIKVNAKMRCSGKTVGEFSAAKGTFLVAGIVKDGKGFVPEDEYVISEGDRLFLLYHPSGDSTLNRWLVG